MQRQPQPVLRTAPNRAPIRSNRSKPVKHAPVSVKPKAATTAHPTGHPTAQQLIMPKSPDASKILVIGDFLANGLAEGLEETFADAPDMQVINQVNGSSGFVRQDYYNWTRELPAILTAQKPDVIVLMIGANDRQSITGKSITVTPDSEEWHKLYTQRADEFISVVNKSGIPLIWVGQPPYKSSTLSQTMLGLNKVFKATAERNAASKQTDAALKTDIQANIWADIWNGFADNDGNYSQTGVDVNGQPARLRGNDGINLTAAGKRKLAFYVEKPLRQLLKPATAIMPAVDTLTSERIIAPASKEITRIGPMSIGDLDQSDDETLLGDTPSKPAQKASAAKRRPTPPFGRTDDFHLR